MANTRRVLSQERVEKLILSGGKKFVSYKEGAELLSMGLHGFQDLAKDANVIYRVKRRVLVNIQMVYDFMEAFHEES